MNCTTKYIFFLFILIITVACSRYPAEVEQALKLAGNNRSELEKTLAYYQERQEDSLKYKAACFLIANMPYYHYFEGNLLEQYSGIYETLATGKQRPQEVLDSYIDKYGRFSKSKLQRKEDIQTITSAYLVQNIEWAFKVWEGQPWGKNIGFDDFCEYILPYKIGDEQSVEWRQILYEKYNPLLDSLRNSPDASDPYVAAYTVIRSLCGDNKHFTTTLPDLPYMVPHIIDRWRSGSCRDLTGLTVYILRALGIASGVDFVPILSLADTGHLWAFVLDKSGRTHTSDYLECIMRPSGKVRNYAPKVYRITFSINKDMESQMQALDPSVPPFFVHSAYTDVTSLYTGRNPIRPVVVADSAWYPQKRLGKIAYLCVPRNLDWYPVTWVPFDKSGVRFNQVKVNTVFRVATWENNQLVFHTDPFIVDTLRNQNILKVDSIKDRVCLFSKYNHDVEFFTLRMIGGIFEGSNHISFESTDTLFVINEEPRRLLNRGQIHSKKKYRYVRYKGVNGSYCDVAEIAFFEHTDDITPLKGKVIGTPNVLESTDHNDYIKALDGNPYTSFHYKEPSGGWVGLELEQPTGISKIVYTPRNRDNFVRKGDLYELFYLDKEWVSAGKKTATADSLVYEHIPTGTLLYLKNHIRGIEERPFLYKDGKQMWW